MPSPTDGTWVEYETATGPNEGDAYEIIRTFSAQLPALQSAVRNRNDVTFLRHGRTIVEQLEADAEPLTELETPPPEKARRKSPPDALEA